MIFDEIKKDFTGLVESGGLSHAYLFSGEEKGNGEEKFFFARCLANFLENGIFEEPEKLLSETMVVSAAGEEKTAIGIDSIRDLKYFIWQKPALSPRRTGIVKGAEKMTVEAQNAALKLVEEPPESSLLIFISDAGENLFPALVSRFQKIHFSVPAGKAGESSVRWKESDIEEILESGRIDEFLKSLLADLAKNPEKNRGRLKEALKFAVLNKRFNVNKRLQLRALISSISKQ